jgi:hypothetical protein
MLFSVFNDEQILVNSLPSSLKSLWRICVREFSGRDDGAGHHRETVSGE